MAIDRNDLIIDEFAQPIFDKSLTQSIKISGGENFLVNPQPNDILVFELLDQFNNLIETREGHLSSIQGLTYENGYLNIDTFEIIANFFKKVRGQYILKISGYRKYIYEDLYDENNNPIDILNESPNNIIYSTVNVVERSKSGREIRVRCRNTDVTSFNNFITDTNPRAIPVDGFYWKFMNFTNDPSQFTTVYFAKNEDGYDTNVNLAFSSEQQYAEHREARGLPGITPDGKYIYSGVREINPDGSNQIVQYIDNQNLLLSETDIWPLYLRVPQPNSGYINLVATNWMYHEYYVKDPKNINDNEQPEPIDTVIFKLAVPADNSIGVDTPMELLRPLFMPFETRLEIDIPVIIDEAFTQLRGPNLKLDVNKNTGKGTIVKNKTDLVGSNPDIASRLEGSIISGSEAVELNVDFREFKNFVNFSSAEERVKNIFYKIGRIEHFASKSAALSTGFAGSDSDVTGSSTHLSEKLRFDNLKHGMLNSFTPYEKYVYYEDKPKFTIYDDDGERVTNPPTYPKQGDERTGLGYNLFSVTSSEAVAWYQATLATASAYDAQNVSLLRNTVPTHIKADPDNDSYTLFLDMVGEHFDDLYFRIQSFENSYRGEENIDIGLSKDLILETAKSFGINLYPGFSSNDLWDYALGTDSSGTYQATGSGETRTFVVKDSHSSNDIEKQQWKRILNNLPLLMKTKGTARGIRALLATYGIPLTILNIDEFGGAPAERNDDKREIQKFNYAINLDGVNDSISTEHQHFKQLGNLGTADSLTTPGTVYRSPSMYEIRIDTAVTKSMYIAKTGHWKVWLEHSSSAAGSDSPSAIAAGSASVYAKYGRIVYEISSSAGQPKISASTDYMPIYDADWWNVSFGVTEHPFKKESTSVPSSQSFQVRCVKAAEHSAGKITHQSTGTVVGNSSSYSGAWSNASILVWGNNGGLSDYDNYSGSFQEIRAWAEYLSDSAFQQHALAATSVVGDSVDMAYNDLLIRLPLGTDGKIYDHSTVLTVTSSLPNTNNLKHTFGGSGEGGLFNNFTGNPYSPKSETYFVKVPHTAGPSKHANKIRIEDNTLRNDQLALEKSFEESSFDSNPLDSEDISVVLSPSDDIDTDIAMQFGGFDLDDFIGDPRDKYKFEYSTLRSIKNKYFKKYTGGTNVMAFVQFLRSFNKGLFKLIEDFIPARADAVVGIEIRPTLLERYKLNQPMSASQETLFHTQSISIRSSHDLPNSDMPNIQTFEGSNFGTLTETIGIGAAPSRQRTGSGDHNYFNLYEGSKYLKDVHGSVTESAIMTIVSESRLAPQGRKSTRIKIPTYNLYNKPEHGKNYTGSGWQPILDIDFSTFDPGTGITGMVSKSSVDQRYKLNEPYNGTERHPGVSDTFRIVSGGGERSIVGNRLTLGNNSGNDQIWMQWNNPFPFEKGALYRMTITFSGSANATDEQDRVYAGFSTFAPDDDQSLYPFDEGWVTNISPNKGARTFSSQNYFVLQNFNYIDEIGLGKDHTARATVAYNYNFLPFTTIINPQNVTQKMGGNNLRFISHMGSGPTLTTTSPGSSMEYSKDINDGRFSHFSPVVIVNYENNDGIVGISQLKVEVLPDAFVNVNPNYDYSPAQKRLIIDGTRITSEDFNVGSEETIDGGPVAEYVLVNPNIITVDGPSPNLTGPLGKPGLGGGNLYTGRPVSNRPQVSAVPAQRNITVR
tara:strand:- start:5017 stop:10059 length:5043 start_codon:yes stop_codon:yes gene_type:complete